MNKKFGIGMVVAAIAAIIGFSIWKNKEELEDFVYEFAYEKGLY